MERNNGEISVLVCSMPTHTDQYVQYSSHRQSLRGLLTIATYLNTATNSSHRYPRGRNQNEFKFIVRWRYSEKLRFILRSHKLISILHTENTLRKPRDQVATGDKNNIIYEIHCSKCEAVYFDESKR